MSKGLKELKDLKNAFVGHCRELKCEEKYIQVCESKFSEIEKELKALDVYKKKILNSEPGLCDSDFREIHIINGNKPPEDSYWVLGVEVSQEDYRLLKEVFYEPYN